MAPSSVNNSAREVMAAIRRQMEVGAWFDHGITPTWASSASFTLSTDLTTVFTTGRPVEIYGSVMGTAYSVVKSSTYVNPVTTITLNDSAVGSTISQVRYSMLQNDNAIPKGLNGNYSLSGSLAVSSLVDISGTLSIATSLVSTKAADSGYTRITSNYCRATTFTDIAGGGGSTRGANGDFTVTAPASAKYVEIAFVLPGGTITTYSDAARTNIFDEALMVSSTNGIFKVIAPSVSGTCYLNLSSYAATVYYDISGYYD